MLSYCAFFLATGLVSALPTPILHPLSDEYIQEINRKQSTWRAGRNFQSEEYELFKTLSSGLILNKAPNTVKIHNEAEEVPEYFDAREAWPECADIIGMIRDQSTCGSCWAFAAVESMSDRICIHSNATRKIIVSAQDALTCAETHGCSGGFMSTAWNYWQESGIVTGGLFNRTDQGCQSYFLPPCENHMQSCDAYVEAPFCSMKCDDSNLNYASQLTYGKDIISFTGEKQMQLEIMKNGPIEAGMRVFVDFANYKSGIYQPTTSESVGGHAIKILGWGVENGTKYWLVANSWNERWGENGFFRIIRGVKETLIGSEVAAGLPDFSLF